MSENTTEYDPRQGQDRKADEFPATVNIANESDTDPEPYRSPPSVAAGPSAMMDFGVGPMGSETVSYPTRFGEYELLGEVARGGMGVVYKARKRGLDRVVALKMVLGLQQTGTSAARFKQEADATAKLDHPNVVPIFDYGEIDGRLFFTMPFVNGPSLKALVEREGVPTIPKALALFAQIVAGVAQAHRHGIVHRDLKPANVLVDPDGRPRVADFGLAKQTADADRPNMTGTGQIMGTPAYMSPEQARDSKDVSAAADVYSLGAVLFFLLTGRAPFVSESIPDLLIKVVTTPPPPPKEINPAVPDDVQALCLKCLEKSPADRFPTAIALAAALAPIVDRYLTPSGVHRPQPPSALLDSASFDAASATQLQETFAGRKKAARVIVWLVAAGILALVGVGLAVAFWPAGPKPVATSTNRSDDGSKPAAPDASATTRAATKTPPAVDDKTWPAPKGDFGVSVELAAKTAADANGVLQMAADTPLELRLRADTDAWVYVFVVDADDNAVLIFPNDQEEDNKISAGITKVVPSKPSYALRTTPTVGDGDERVRVVATTREQSELKRGQPIGKYREFRDRVAKDELRQKLRQLRGIEIVPTAAAVGDPAKAKIGEAELRFRVK
jgi:serine/threonine protein kinase